MTPMSRTKTVPDKQRRIPDGAVDPGRYTETLMSAAYAAGMYDDGTVMAVRGGLFELLAARLTHFTNGESCSVAAETAQAVLSALLYTVDLRLLAEADPDAAAVCLVDTAPAVLFDGGLCLLKRKLRASELLWRKHLPLFRSLPDSVMKTTAVDGIAGFFRAYRPEGLADIHPITADYPLFCGMNAVSRLRGVSFLAGYLQGLCNEARFLSKFRADTVHAVLSAADTMYRETPSNLFAPLYATAVGMVLLGHPFSAWKYGLTGEDIDAIQRMYDDGVWTKTQVLQASARVTELLMLDDAAAAYVRQAAEVLYDSSVGCLSRHLPMNVFPCTDAAYRKQHRGITMVPYDDIAFLQAMEADGGTAYHGGRMDAEAFRCLDYDLRTCTSADEKTEMILARVRGLEDICDLLSSDTDALDAAERDHLMAALPIPARQILSGMMGHV